MRWQVSRLAEQDFSSDPRLPDLSVSGQLGISPVTVAGAAAFEPDFKALSHSLFACHRTGTSAWGTICPSEGLVKPKEGST